MGDFASYVPQTPSGRPTLGVGPHPGGAEPIATPTPFVGRIRELALLDAALEAARRGHRQVAFVEGAAGSGKSALVRAFLDRTSGDVPTIVARGIEGGRGRTMGVLDQIMAGLEPGPPARPAHDRDPFTVAMTLIDRVGRAPEPTVIVVEDAHWADGPSLQGLAFALRRLPHDGVLVVVTACGPALGPGLAAIRGLASDGGRVIELAGLTADDGRALGAACGCPAVSDDRLARLLHDSEGMPFPLAMLLAAEATEAQAGAAGSISPAPAPTFAALVAERLSRLRGDSLSVVEAAAVLGARPRLAEVAEVAEVPVDRVEAACSAGALSELIGLEATTAARPGLSDRCLQFRHPTVRLEAYRRLSASRRRRLHRRAAALPGDPRTTLRHAIDAAAGFDPELAETVTARALVAEADGNWADAASWSLAAAQLREPGPGREDDLVRGALCSMLSGDIGVASSILDGPTEFGDSAVLRFLRGRMAALHGHLQQAVDHMGEAWEMDRTSNGALLAAADLSAIAYASGQGDEAAVWAMRAFSLGKVRAGQLDVDPLSRFLIATGIAGRAEDGLAFAAATADRFGRAATDRADGLLGRGVLHHFVGHVPEAERDLAEASGIGRRVGPFHRWCSTQGWRAAVAYQAGRWDDAIRFAVSATSAADSEAWPYAAMVHCALALPLASRGATAEAAAAIEQARSGAGRSGNQLMLQLIIAATAAWLAVVEDEPAEAIALCQPWLAEGAALLDAVAPPIVRTFGIASLRRGNVAGVERAADMIEGQPHPAGPAWAAALRMGAADLVGDDDRAERHHQEVVARLPRLVAPFEWAQIMLELGIDRRAHGTEDEAVHHLDQARLAFSLLGATPFVARCDDQLAAFGARPAPRSTPPISLGPTERVIASMLRAGQPEDEIAAELVIGRGTLDHHLAELSSRLEVTGRDELLDALHRSA